MYFLQGKDGINFFFKNPFYIYIVSFVISYCIYFLDWSVIYPQITSSHYIFIILSLCLSFVCGKLYSLYFTVRFNTNGDNNTLKRLLLLVLFLSCFEIIYDYKTPLYMVLSGDANSHKEFVTNYGFPVIHPFIIAASSLCAVGFSEIFSRLRNKSNFLMFCLSLAPAFIFFSRGSLTITFLAVVFCFFINKKRIKLFQIFFALLVCLIGLFLFGLAGNARVGDPGYILKIGGASEKFYNSFIPNEFFWGFLYISSPIGNLQTAIDENPGFVDDPNKILLFTIDDIVPDIFSKRIKVLFDLKEEERSLIVEALTVGTMYSRPYTTFGWLAVFFIFIYFVLFSITIPVIFNRNSPFYLYGSSFVAALASLLIFTNTLVFSGVLFPILLAAVVSWRFKNNNE